MTEEELIRKSKELRAERNRIYKAMKNWDGEEFKKGRQQIRELSQEIRSIEEKLQELNS